MIYVLCGVFDWIHRRRLYSLNFRKISSYISKHVSTQSLHTKTLALSRIRQPVNELAAVNTKKVNTSVDATAIFDHRSKWLRCRWIGADSGFLTQAHTPISTSA